MVIYTKALKSMMPRKLSLALLLAAGSISSLFADNRISVQDFTIVDGKTAVVSVKMENDPNVTSLGATIQLPAGMSIVQEYDKYTDDNVNFILNSSRTYDPEKLYDEQTLQRHFLMDNEQAANKYIIAIGHDEELPFIGNSGEEIFHFTVQADGALADNTQLEFTDVHFDIKEGNTRDEVLQDDFTVNVTKVASLPPVGIITTDVQEFSITPGRSHYKIVTVSMNNDSDISGVQMKIVLPTGLKFVTGVEGFPGGVSYNERSKKLQPKLNRETGVLTMSTMNKTDKILAGEGEIFAFLVEADTSLPAESQIDINGIRLTTMYKRPGAAVETAYTITPDPVAIKVLNPDAAAKPAADKAIADAQAALDALKEEYADVIANGNMPAAVQAAQDAVDALKKKIDDAWEAGELAETDYSAEVAAAEQTLAQAKYIGDEERAKVAADKVLADLQKLYDEAVAKVAADYPEVKDAKAVTDVEKAAQDLIDAYKNKVNEAYGLKNLQTATTTEWENLAKAGIEKIVPEAAAAQAAKVEAEAQAENQTILTNAQKQKEAAEAIAADVPSVWGDKVKQERDNLNAAMDALRKAVNDAAAAGTAHTQEVKDDVSAKAQAVEDAAAALQVKAETVKNDYKAEAAQQAYNTDLYNKVHADAKKAIEDVPTEIENKMGNFISAVNEADAALKQAIDDAAFNNNANTDDSKANIAALEKAERDAIDAMKAASQQFYKEYKDEIAQQEANDKILNDVVDAQTDAKRIKNNAQILKRDDAVVKLAERALDDAVDALRDQITEAKQTNTANTTASKTKVETLKTAAEAAATALRAAVTAAQASYDLEMAAQESNSALVTEMDKQAKEAINAVPTEVQNDVKAEIDAVNAALAALDQAVKDAAAEEKASQTSGERAVNNAKKTLDDAIAALNTAKETAVAEKAALDGFKDIVAEKQKLVDAAKLEAATDPEVAAYDQVVDALASLENAQKALEDAVAAHEAAKDCNTPAAQAEVGQLAQAVDGTLRGVYTAIENAKQAIAAEKAAELANEQTVIDYKKKAEDAEKAATVEDRVANAENVKALRTQLAEKVQELEKAVADINAAKTANTQESKGKVGNLCYQIDAIIGALNGAVINATNEFAAQDAFDETLANTMKSVDAIKEEVNKDPEVAEYPQVVTAVAALDAAVKALEDAIAAHKAAGDCNTDAAKGEIAQKAATVAQIVSGVGTAINNAKAAIAAEKAAELANEQKLADNKAKADEAERNATAIDEVANDERVKALREQLADAVKALEDAIIEINAAKTANTPQSQGKIGQMEYQINMIISALNGAVQQATAAYEAEVAAEQANEATVLEKETVAKEAEDAVNALIAAEVAEEQAALNKALDDLKAAVKAAKDAKNASDDAVKEDIAKKAEAVDTAAEALKAAADEAKKAYDAEQLAQADNKAAVTAAEATQAEATNAVPTEVKNDVAAEQKALDDAVNALKEAVDAAEKANNASDPDVKADIDEKKQAVKDAAAALADAAQKAKAEYDAQAAFDKTLADVKKSVEAVMDEVNKDPEVAEYPQVVTTVAALNDAVKALEDAINAHKEAGDCNTPAAQGEIAGKAGAIGGVIGGLNTAINNAKQAIAAEKAAETANEQALADYKKKADDAEKNATAIDEVANDPAVKGLRDQLADAVKALEDAIIEINAAKKANDPQSQGKIGQLEYQIDQIINALNGAVQQAKDAYDASEAAKEAELAEQAKNTQTVTDAEKEQTDATNAVPVEVKDAVAAEQQALDDAVKALQDAVNAAAEAGNANTDEVKADIAAKKQAVTDAATALKDAAAAAKEAYDKQQLQDAIKGDLAGDIAVAQDAIVAVDAAIKSGDPDVYEDYVDDLKDIQDRIDALTDDLDTKYGEGALTEESNYDEEIAAILEDLKALQDAADKAENEYLDKKAANQRGYDRLNGEIADVQKVYDEVKDYLDEEQIWDEYFSEMKDIQNSIDDLSDEVKNRYDNMELTDDSKIDSEKQQILDRLNELMKKAEETVGIVVVRAGKPAADVTYFDMNGKRIEMPLKGQMIIVKYADGTTKKALVK